jgi:quinol monooxygenase YgiN
MDVVTLLAHYVTESAETASILADLEAMCRAVEAEEPGCLAYRVLRDAEHPDEIWLYEVYDGPDSFDAHRLTPHFRFYIEERIAPRLIRRERHRLDQVGGIARHA